MDEEISKYLEKCVSSPIEAIEQINELMDDLKEAYKGETPPSSSRVLKYCSQIGISLGKAVYCGFSSTQARKILRYLFRSYQAVKQTNWRKAFEQTKIARKMFRKELR